MLNLSELFQKTRPLSVNKLEDVGDILQYLLPWAALLAVALQGDAEAAWRWLYAGSITVTLTLLGKFLFNFTPLGTRPNGGRDSFPSGHTSSAFMGAAFVHFHFGWPWAILPYLLAALTGYSRIQANKHWLRDVIAGAVLAVVTGYFTVG